MNTVGTLIFAATVAFAALSAAVSPMAASALLPAHLLAAANA